MPVATSSRRKKNARSNRAPSSDGIEEDQPTQGGEDDEVDDDEEGDQPSRSARVKKEKLVKGRRLAPKAPARDEDDDDDDGEGDAEDADMGRIDVENFKDQPLSREDAGKVSGIIKDWEMIRKRNDDAAKGLMENIGISMADLMEEEEATKSLAELDTVMREILDVEEEMALNETTINELYQQLCSGVPIESPVEIYEKAMKKKLNEYRVKTTRQKYAKKKAYQTFREAIHEAQYPDKAIPPITEFIPKEDGDISDDDDDLEMGGVTQVYTCPISLTMLVNPVTSQVCGHSFSQTAIHGFLGNNRNKREKCPAAGCTQQISIGDLQPDKGLEKKVKAAERRLKRQQEDSDDDEVIE